MVLESTTYPGTTQELMVPILEAHSGLTVDKDFFVGYSPERIDPGNKTYTFTSTPKVVSGTSPESTKRVAELYESLVDTVVIVSSSARGRAHQAAWRTHSGTSISRSSTSWPSSAGIWASTSGRRSTPLPQSPSAS